MSSNESKSKRVRVLGQDDPRKTHVVADLVLYEEEGGGVCYPGTFKDCIQWVNMQGYGYEIRPMTEDELKLYNDEENI